MLIVPAIDLLAGRCVRLTRGAYDSPRVYSEDPVSVARELEQQGAVWLHVVDLDAARGSGSNRELIARIRESSGCRVQVGGGVRSADAVAELLDRGVHRVVVGTVLVRDPEAVGSWAARWPGRIVAGIDARDGEVSVSGWTEGSGMLDTEAARLASRIGCLSVVYTSINRDGTLRGPDLERTNGVAAACGCRLLLSGGIGSQADVELAARERHPGVVGLITGKAVYEGKVDLQGAIRAHQRPGDEQLW